MSDTVIEDNSALNNNERAEQALVLTDSQCWDIVNFINWPQHKNVDVVAHKRRLMLHYDKVTMDAFSNWVSARVDFLHTTISELEDHLSDARGYEVRIGDYSGDDSFRDMCHEIVGRGEYYYNEAVADPLTRLSGMRHTESFSYVIPFGTDWSMLEKEYFKLEAVQAFEEVLQRRIELGGSVEASLIIELLARFHCMSLGYMNRAVENLEQIDYKRLSGLGDYRFPNLIFDCWRWIVLPMHEMSVGQLR